jgi:hypothetical protein
MRTVSVTVGPLAAASATAISLSQTAPAAQALVLNNTSGLSTRYVVNSIGLTQSVASATTAVLNGASVLASGIAWLTPPKQIVITSVGNDTSINFVVAGIGVDGRTAYSETIKGSNASTTSTTGFFWQVISVKTTGATAGNIQIGVNGVATMDKPRRVLITSGGNDNGITFAISGIDVNGAPISETLTGGNIAAVYSVLDYATVTQIKPSAASAGTVTVGTNGVASSPWVFFDQWANAQGFAQCNVTGTVNYTIEMSQDNPNSSTDPVVPSAMVWNSTASPVVGATATAQALIAGFPQFARITLNSGTGSVIGCFTQNSVTPR